MKARILVSLMVACGTAQASDWVSLGKTSDGKQEHLVDVSSIRVAGNIRRAWIKVIYAHQTLKGFDDDVQKWQNYAVSRTAFDCSQETARYEALNVYFDDGTTYSVPANTYPTPWEPVAPDTASHAEMQYVCTWKAK